MTDLSLTDPRVLRAIELVWKEAEALDAKDYKSWEQMYTDDGIYVIPIDPDTDDFASSLNMVYDDARMRRLRVQRMLQGYSPSAVAAARTVRVISRFTVQERTDTSVTLRSAQIVFDDEGDDRIALKVIRLIDSEDAVSASGYLL